LFLINNYLYLVAETSERNAIEIIILIKITDNTLINTILIYSNYNLKDRLLIKALYLVFILKAGGIEGGLLQLFYIKFSLISSVIITANNNEINSIF
jgi:hypothetical protein